MGRRQFKCNYYSILAGFLLYAGGALSFAQDRNYIWDHFNISNGLISDMVLEVIEDSEGHAWVVTYNGLQKYNGYGFKTYTSNPIESGHLSSNFVDNLFEDREGDLIVILEDGIDIYDKYSDRFYNLLSDVPFGDSRRDEISRPSSAVQDKSGTIWVNCNNQMIRIDSSKEDFIIYPDKFRGRFVLNADSTLLWIINDQEIKKYDLERNLLTINEIEDFHMARPVRQFNTIFYDSEGICWIGTSNGLYAFDEKNFRLLDPSDIIPGIDTRQEEDLRSDITAIFEDYRSDLWIASGSLLRRISRGSGEIEFIQHEFENPNSILDEQITGIYGNKNGIVWITYMNEGFSRVNIRTNNFRSYRLRPNNARSLGGNTVRSIFKDDDGYIWLGLYNNGLDRINPGTGSITHFKYNSEFQNSICSNYISSILMDRNHRLWVGSHDNGLCYSDDAQQSDPEFKVPSFLNNHEEIYHIQEDNLGRIWFGTRNGLGVYNYNSGMFNWVLKGHNVQSFIFENRTIWIASWNYGLCKLSFSEPQFEAEIPAFDSLASLYYGYEKSEKESQSRYENSGGNQNCISIYQDQDNNIWLGTYDRGLLKAVDSGSDIQYTAFDQTHGAPGNSIYGVSGDENGSIWISTEHGLGKFDPETETFENYYRGNGILSNYFMWKSYFRAKDGELFFGSVDGLNTFYPHMLNSDTVVPRIMISELRINNNLVGCQDTVNGDVLLKRHIAYQDTLVLSYWNRDFSIGYYATGYINHQKLKYAYMLKGYDEDWISSSIDYRLASYNSLSKGTYFLRIKASENDITLPGPYKEMVIVILPPWWKSGVAFVIYMVLISGLVFLIANTLIQFIGLKHELKYNEKLHQSKLMFFTNISHDFKTPLSLIKAPLDDMVGEASLSPHDRKNLLVARKNADNLLNLVDELMEFRRTDTGNSKLRAELLDLTAFIGEVAAQFDCIAEQKGVHFYYDIPDLPIHLWIDRKKGRRIINNLLENAMKYTGEEGLVTLSIITDLSRFRFKPNLHTLRVNQARGDHSYVGVLVSDTGMGISQESLPHLFDRFYQIEAEKAWQHIGSGIGLALVKNLVLMHKGEIRVASERGIGTEILVLFPSGSTHLKNEEMITNMVEQAQVFPVVELPNLSKYPLEIENLQTEPNASVLLVEDHISLREFLKDHISEFFAVLEASNGFEALKILENHKPDLIITDWIMPGMDGASLIREIRSNDNTATIPVILLTAKDELKDRQEGLNLGADQVIPKPFNIQLLISQVKRTIKNNDVRLKRFSLDNMEKLVHVRENRDASFIEEVERSIRDHIRDTNLNAGMISRDLGCSRTSLYDKIKGITGMSIGEYIQRIRLKQAIKLMLYEGVSVSEVYILVGFGSSSYMIRLFKKYYHTTPGEYVKNYLKSTSN